MKRWSYDLALAVAAGLIVLGITVWLDWLDGWHAWAAAVVVAVTTLMLLVLVAHGNVNDRDGSGSYGFLRGVRAKKDLEVRDTSVASTGESASHVTDSKAGGSIKIIGSKFTHNEPPADAISDADDDDD